VSDLYLIT